MSGFWEGKEVLVTGGAGFIGSRAVRQLLEHGARVTVVDNLSKGEAANLAGMMERVRFVQADLMDPKVAREVLKGKDACVHFAAKIGGIGYFHKYPGSSLRDNSVLNFNLWEAARETKPLMVCVSSSMVFERTGQFPTPEGAVLTSPPPITGYGFSKLVDEYIARTYQEEYGIPFAIARPFNAYGPGERTGDFIGYAHVIPDIVKKVRSGQHPLEILGDGMQSRSYTYVDDVASGVLYIAEHGRNDDFNIGTGMETTVRELAERIWAICGRKEPIAFKQMPVFATDVRKRVPDVKKLFSIGWRPIVDLQSGLKETVEWILKNEGA